MAAAGLIRLGMQGRIAELISADISLPAVGQGAVGIECRNDDAELIALLAGLNHAETALRVKAERAMNARLQGGCQVPIGSFATLSDDRLQIKGMVGQPDGSELLFAQAEGTRADAENLGIQVAEALLAQGAGEILQALQDNN